MDTLYQLYRTRMYLQKGILSNALDSLSDEITAEKALSFFDLDSQFFSSIVNWPPAFCPFGKSIKFLRFFLQFENECVVIFAPLQLSDKVQQLSTGFCSLVDTLLSRGTEETGFPRLQKKQISTMKSVFGIFFLLSSSCSAVTVTTNEGSSYTLGENVITSEDSNGTVLQALSPATNRKVLSSIKKY